MLYGMAEDGQVLPIFKRLHPRFGTPIYAILFVGALPLVDLIWSRADVNDLLPLTIAASTSWLLAYVVAQISLIVLRWRNPRAPRPFRVPRISLGSPVCACGNGVRALAQLARSCDDAPYRGVHGRRAWGLRAFRCPVGQARDEKGTLRADHAASAADALSGEPA
jgi:hypothetical protein